MNEVGFGHRLCAGWVHVYTSRMPAEVARQRRDELRSDRWEHAALAQRDGQGHVAHQFEVISRMLKGLPADLSWRRQAKWSDQPRPAALLTIDQANPTEVTMSKRLICRIIGHKYRSYPYPGGGDAGGRYVLCHRCRHERDITLGHRPPGAGGLASG